MSTLVIADASGRVIRRIDLYGRERLTIGRSTQRDLIVNDPGISRFHCILYLEAGTWCIADAGSRGGTIVEGHGVVWKRMPPGRIAQIGHLLFRVESSEDVDLESPRPGLEQGPSLAPIDAKSVNHGFPVAEGLDSDAATCDPCGRTSAFLTAETDFLIPADRMEIAGR